MVRQDSSTDIHEMNAYDNIRLTIVMLPTYDQVSNQKGKVEDDILNLQHRNRHTLIH